MRTKPGRAIQRQRRLVVGAHLEEDPRATGLPGMVDRGSQQLAAHSRALPVRGDRDGLDVGVGRAQVQPHVAPRRRRHRCLATPRTSGSAAVRASSSVICSSRPVPTRGTPPSMAIMAGRSAEAGRPDSCARPGSPRTWSHRAAQVLGLDRGTRVCRPQPCGHPAQRRTDRAPVCPGLSAVRGGQQRRHRPTTRSPSASRAARSRGTTTGGCITPGL